MGIDLSFQAIVGLLFIAFAIFMGLRTVRDVASAFESKNWPEAAGVVLFSRVDESSDGEGGRLFKASIRYRFEAQGRELTGSRACFGDSTSTNIAALARGIEERYRAGQAVTVRYNPDKPSECVLEPGFNLRLVLDFVFGCFFLTLGVYLSLGSA
jgi:hypothetical protein